MIYVNVILVFANCVGAGSPRPKWNARKKEGAETAPLRFFCNHNLLK